MDISKTPPERIVVFVDVAAAAAAGFIHIHNEESQGSRRLYRSDIRVVCVFWSFGHLEDEEDEEEG